MNENFSIIHREMDSPGIVNFEGDVEFQDAMSGKMIKSNNATTRPIVTSTQDKMTEIKGANLDSTEDNIRTLYFLLTNDSNFFSKIAGKKIQCKFVASSNMTKWSMTCSYRAGGQNYQISNINCLEKDQTTQGAIILDSTEKEFTFEIQIPATIKNATGLYFCPYSPIIETGVLQEWTKESYLKFGKVQLQNVEKQVSILGIQGQKGTKFKLNNGGEISLEFDGIYELDTEEIGMGKINQIEITTVPTGSVVSLDLVIEGGNTE